MKIAIVTAAWYGGGAESIARDSFEFLRNKGNECYYLYSRGSAPKDNNIIKVGNFFDPYLHYIYSTLFDHHGFASSSTTNNLINLLEKLDADIIHLHNIICYSYNVKSLFTYLKKCNKRIFWTLHDCWPFTGHCTMFDVFDCNKWKKECGNCVAKHYYPTSLFMDCSKRNIIEKRRLFAGVKDLTIITPSEWLKNNVEKTYLRNYRIEKIYNGINLDKFHYVDSTLRNKYSIDLKKKVLLAVAQTWEERKGIGFLLELQNILDTELYQLVVIGNCKCSFNKNVIVIPRTNNIEELVKWYSCADVFVNPTIADNFPTVNIEALACGTPVVTFDTGGSWESVGENCGECVLIKSAEALLGGHYKLFK